MEAFWISPRPSAYLPVWQAMQAFTRQRGPHSPDQLWLTEHCPVYTLGQAGKPEHVLAPGTIPLLATDRGGQVTYHGPGQLVVYVLLDLHRAGYFVKTYVSRLEDAVIGTLRALGLAGATRYPGAPGVYLPLDAAATEPHPDQPMARYAKIAALGVKVSRGCTYHGIALNVAMDLAPFSGINPCGYAGLATTDLAAQGVHVGLDTVAGCLVEHLHVALLGAPAPASISPYPRRNLTELALPPAALS